jgi:hypothetical protein
MHPDFNHRLLGHDYLAEKIASYILSISPSLAPQTYPLFNPAAIAGTYDYSVSNGTLLSAGQHQVSVTFTPQDSANYATATQNAVISVVKASSSISVSANSGSIGPGNVVTITAKVSPQIGGVPTGTVAFIENGTVVGSSPLDSSGSASFTASWPAIGTHQISATYSGDGNFYGSATSAAIPITVMKPDFTMSISPTKITVVPGQSATFALTVTPIAGLSANLNLTCTGLPANTSCGLQNTQQQAVNQNTQQVAVNQRPTTASVVIQAFASRAEKEDILKFPDGVQLCGLFGILLIFRRKKVIPTLIVSALLLVVGLSFVGGCGSGAKISTPEPGTYNVNIVLTSATDASLTHSQSVTVVIP